MTVCLAPEQIDDLVRDVDFHPSTPIEEGIAKFVAWYREYYKV